MKKTDINAIYVHIPFCKSICAYCDFCKIIYQKQYVLDYLKALKKELDFYSPLKSKIKTVYFGGGTPSCLESEDLKTLLDIFKEYLLNSKENTFECNPETLNKEKLEILYKYNINRLSIGVESFDNEILKFLKRKHNLNDINSCIDLARQVGFKNINIDLIYGFKNQSLKQVKKDIDLAIKLNVEHISVYSLIIEKHTLFYINKIKSKSNDTLRKYFDYIHKTLKKSGYLHYEISNFAKPSYQSKHNLIYWRDLKYYGLGASSAGYIDKIRYKNSKSVFNYIKNPLIKYEIENINLKDDIMYFLMLNLRTSYGIMYSSFIKRFNIDINIIKDTLLDLKQKKLLKLLKRRFVLTYQGAMILDSVVIEIILALENKKVIL